MLARLRSSWTAVVPVVGLTMLAVTWGVSPGPVLATVIAVVLVGVVLAAVHHAEVVAERVGEPFGSLVLAVAVTVIEVALIVTLIASGGEGSHSLARDTVFAAVMITANGIVGIALLVGARKYGIPRFNPEGAGAALAVVTTLATLTLVLPTFTSARPGPEFSPLQLGFAAVASLALYGVFVLTQTVRHATSSFPSCPPTTAKTACMAPPPPTGPPTQAWRCCVRRWSPSSDWPKPCPRSLKLV